MDEVATLSPSQRSASEDASLLPSIPDADATIASEASRHEAIGDARAPAGYAIERELGRGGMGVVYLARSVALQRPCALKMILSGVHSGDAEVERFRTEAQAIARLQHPGIVQVFEVGEYDGRPFMALEFCGGGSLDAKLAEGPLKPREAALLVKALAEAVQAAHEANVLHRDLKPANVLLTEKGEPKVTDFGLAKKLDEQGATRTGSVMGTPSYMPPEQAEGKKDVGPAADVYALGAILYECLASRPPFKAATALDTILQVVSEEPVPLRRLNRQAPADLETIAHKCLQKDPSKRYPTAQGLADDLGRYLKGEPIVARPVGAVERAVKWVRRNRAISALAAATTLTLAAGVVISSWFAYAASQEATAARKAEREAEDRAEAEAEARGIAQREKVRADEQLDRAEHLVYAGRLSLAQSAFAEGDGAVALRYLDKCQRHRRGWEHSHLWTRFNSRQTLLGHENSVWCVASSPDGRRIVTGGSDKTARVWDAEKGLEILRLSGHGADVWMATFSPDGQHIATGSMDGTAKVWGARMGKEIRTFKGHLDRVTAAAWSPDGSRLLTGSCDDSAKVFDVRTGKEIRTFKGHASGVTSAAWSPDGKRVVTGSHDSTARVWDVETGRELLALKKHVNSVHCVAWSPDGERIATGSNDRTAKVWDARTGRLLLSLDGHASKVDGMSFSPDGGRVATASGDRTAKVWDARTGQLHHTLKGHADEVANVAWSPDGRRIFTSSRDGTAKVWDAWQGQDILSIKESNCVYGVSSSPNGNRLAVATLNNTANVWDIPQGRVLLTLKGHANSFNSMEWSRDGARIVSSNSDSTARVWDARNGRELLTIRGHDRGRAVKHASFSPDARRVVTASDDNTARVWDGENGRELVSLEGHADVVWRAVFSPDGKRIVTASGDRTAKVWDAQKGQLVRTLSHAEQVLSVAWSPDGARILTTGSDRAAKIWDAERGQQVLSLEGHTDSLYEAVYSPDGKRIATASDDGTVRVWEAEKGREVLTLKGHAGRVSSVAWSRDGQQIATGSLDGTARVWVARTAPAILALEGRPAVVKETAWDLDRKRFLAWDDKKKPLAWSLLDGEPVDPTAPPLPQPGADRSPDGDRRLLMDASSLLILDEKLHVRQNAWP
jgi:WD40 repeat protein